MSIQVAKRRRRQAANGYVHLPKKKRPKYAKRSAEVQNKRLQRKIDKQKEMARRKKG